MTTLEKVCVTVALAAAIGVGIFEARQNSLLRRQIQSLQLVADQNQQFQQERDDVSNRLAVLSNKISQNKTDESELLKLRADVTRLKSDPGDPADVEAKAWLAKINKLKQRLEEMPGRKIPELQFLTAKDWGDAAWNADLDTDDGIRQALSKLREEAENTFLNEMMKAAIKKYMAANNGILPPSLLDLKSYFDAPVTDAMLQRYQLLQSGVPDPSAPLVKSIGYADDDYDTYHEISINGAWGSGYNKAQSAVNTAAGNFSKDNNGQLPTDPAQLSAYLDKPLDPVTVQKYLNQITSDTTQSAFATLAPAVKAYSDANGGKEPQDPSQLLPYVTTPAQQAALKKLSPGSAASSK